MEMTEKKNDLKSMMVESMEKVKEMVDANNIVGEPITTPDDPRNPRKRLCRRTSASSKHCGGQDLPRGSAV